MFIGHFAVGFAAKKAAPSVSLGVLFIAAQFLDLLWPTLLLLGVERAEIVPGITKLTPLDFIHYPITHSLLMVLLWSAVIGGIYYAFKRDGKVALILGFCVLSHWLLDLLVHRPDLPLYPGDSPKAGFGLWNNPPVAIVLEVLLFVICAGIYHRSTKPKNRMGSVGFWFLALFLFLVYLANILGPPPPNMQAVAWAGHLQWIFVLLAFWVDQNRRPAVSTATQ
jgi:membrane-bound metal-dependent hydrolase YbcI (DUF457 family)